MRAATSVIRVLLGSLFIVFESPAATIAFDPNGANYQLVGGFTSNPSSFVENGIAPNVDIIEMQGSSDGAFTVGVGSNASPTVVEIGLWSASRGSGHSSARIGALNLCCPIFTLQPEAGENVGDLVTGYFHYVPFGTAGILPRALGAVWSTNGVGVAGFVPWDATMLVPQTFQVQIPIGAEVTMSMWADSFGDAIIDLKMQFSFSPTPPPPPPIATFVPEASSGLLTALGIISLLAARIRSVGQRP